MALPRRNYQQTASQPPQAPAPPYTPPPTPAPSPAYQPPPPQEQPHGPTGGDYEQRPKGQYTARGQQGKFLKIFDLFVSKSGTSYTRFLKKEDLDAIDDMLSKIKVGDMFGFSESRNPNLVQLWWKVNEQPRQ